MIQTVELFNQFLGHPIELELWPGRTFTKNDISHLRRKLEYDFEKFPEDTVLYLGVDNTSTSPRIFSYTVPIQWKLHSNCWEVISKFTNDNYVLFTVSAIVHKPEYKYSEMFMICLASELKQAMEKMLDNEERLLNESS